MADLEETRREPPGAIAALQPPQRWKRYEKPLPGLQVHIDVKFVTPLSSKERYYQYTAIDDRTRLRVLRL